MAKDAQERFSQVRQETVAEWTVSVKSVGRGGGGGGDGRGWGGGEHKNVKGADRGKREEKETGRVGGDGGGREGLERRRQGGWVGMEGGGKGWRDGGKDGEKKSGTKKVRRDTDRHRNRILTSQNRTGERGFRRLLPTSFLLVVFSRPSEIT